MTEIPAFLKEGTQTIIGAHEFTEDDILRYGKAYLPFDCHTGTNCEGGLVAAGLHIASVWMSLQRSHIAEETKRLQDADKTFPIFGPSPGVEYMKWPHPVFKDDVITFRNHIQKMRQSVSRPGWWIMTNLVTGINESRKTVLEFQSSVLVTLKKDG